MALLATRGSAEAVTINLTAVANNTVGLVTGAWGTSALVSGNVYLFSSVTDLNPFDLDGMIDSGDSLAFFAAKLGNDALLLRTTPLVNGAFASSGSVEVGPPGNRLYMLIISTDLGWVGAYQNINAPAAGTVVMSPATMTQDLLGSSTLQSISGVSSGYQLAGYPEPSTALLSLLGIVPLIRRRR